MAEVPRRRRRRATGLCCHSRIKRSRLVSGMSSSVSLSGGEGEGERAGDCSVECSGGKSAISTSCQRGPGGSESESVRISGAGDSGQTGGSMESFELDSGDELELDELELDELELSSLVNVG